MPPAPSLRSSLYWPICWASIAAFCASRRERASRDREHEDGGRAQRQQREQAPERPPQDRQRAEGLGVVDFGDDADVAVGQPFPGADDRHAAIVAIAVDVHAGAPGDRFASGVRERQARGAAPWAMASGDVAARIAHEQLQNRTRVVLVGQQAQQDQARRRSGCCETIRPFLSKA